MDEKEKQAVADGFALLRQKLHQCHVNTTKWMQKAKQLESELGKSEARVRELSRDLKAVKERIYGVDETGPV